MALYRHEWGEFMGQLWWPETMAVLLRWDAPTQGPHLAALESQESVKDSPGLLTPGHMPE